MRKALHGLHHQSEKRQSIMSADLLNVQEISKCGLSLRFHLCQVHGIGEIVDETAVDIENVRLTKCALSLRYERDKNVTDFLISIPIAYAVIEEHPKEKMTMKDVGYTME